MWYKPQFTPIAYWFRAKPLAFKLNLQCRCAPTSDATETLCFSYLTWGSEQFSRFSTWSASTSTKLIAKSKANPISFFAQGSSVTHFDALCRRRKGCQSQSKILRQPLRLRQSIFLSKFSGFMFALVRKVAKFHMADLSAGHYVLIIKSTNINQHRQAKV